MCFAPYISISTFVIEFLLALFFLMRNPKDKLNRIIALLSLLLGIYQLNEFLICVTNLNIFTRLAMITTAILPSIGITYALIIWRKKLKYYWHLLIYSPAIFFIVMFSMPFYFSNNAFCDRVFIKYPSLGLLGDFYALYYFGYIIASLILFYIAGNFDTSNKVINNKIKTSKDYKYYKGLLGLGALGMLIFTVPTYIFLQFLPSLNIEFSSVLCEFALLLAIELIIVIWYKEKYKLEF